jgi:hypothetical protein
MNTTETNTAGIFVTGTTDIITTIPFPNNTTTASSNFWGYPEQLEVNEVGETIEMIYKQTSNAYRTGGLPPYNDTRIFKIVYSCVDGKWNKSEPIYGKIVPAQEEYYDFDL